MKSSQKGALAESAIAIKATQLGIPVLRPMVDQLPYDLAFEVGGRLLRVQCKWAQLKGGVLEIRTGRCYHSPTQGYVRKTYTADEVDLLVAYCAELDRCYALPLDVFCGKHATRLRIDPPGNNQRAAINFAGTYELGAIAQLEERLNGIQEAEGSSPSSSTSRDLIGVDDADPVGAHDFRNRFGWYMERASQGERFLITRRGRPYARLTPP